MEEDFENLIERYHEKVAHIEDRTAKMAFCANLEEKISEIRDSLKGANPDDVKIANLLVELRSKIKLAPTRVAGLQPSLRDFKKKLKTARNLIQEKSQIDRSALDHQKALDEIDKEGETAYDKGDKYRWSVLNESVDNIIRDLESIGPTETTSPDLPPPEVAAPMIKQYALEECDRLATDADRKGKLFEIESELKSLRRQIENRDVRSDPRTALYDIVGLMQTKFAVLKRKVGYEGSKDDKIGLLS